MVERGWLQKLMPVAVALVAIGGAAVLATWNPSEHAFPKCVFRTATGFYCPGCGSQRAIHNLLRGNIGLAVHFNFFTVISVPIILLGYLQWTMETFGKGRPITWRAPAIWIWGFLITMLIYTFLRNIPIDPLSNLAPPARV